MDKIKQESKLFELTKLVTAIPAPNTINVTENCCIIKPATNPITFIDIYIIH
jgi:hypothetical protein